ncbi:methionine--tRNA ligase [Patescibacteria group bacterium]
MNKFYITTSIMYANAKPHIGFALESIQADVLARLHRQKGEKTFFLTGTDEHGIKVYRTAKEAGKDIQDFCNEISQNVKDLKKVLNLSNDDFIRTSDPKHKKASQALWKLCEKDIYKKKYKGLYCVGCERFLPKKELVDGKCPNHNKEPELIEEENYFFKLSNYQDKLLDFYKNNSDFVIPEKRFNEIKNLVKEELTDISISRTKEKLPWGVPVPGDESQIMYVWFDALTNYISALGWPEETDRFKTFWPADIHVIGKDINRFHTVIWPAMLMSAGIELPKQVLVHGFISSEGKKMSKSLGNVVDPVELVKKYGTDAVRYYLLREIPTTEDGDFSQERFKERYNADLANDLGNLLNRVLTMINNYKIKPIKFKKKYASIDELKKDYPQCYIFDNKRYEESLKKFRFDFALEEIWKVIAESNQLIDKEKPWVLVNTDKKKLEFVLQNLHSRLEVIGCLVEPFLPETGTKIRKQLETLKPEVLFPKITD